jgi:predicted DNA-binding transcriptional regulator YafY
VAAPLLRLGRAVAGSPGLRRFQVRRPEAFVRWILGFGGAAAIVEPAALVEEYRRVAAAALAVYEPGGAG